MKAAEYVEVVVRMEILSMNFMGRSGEAFRDAVSAADHRWHTVHDTLISDIDIINHICDQCNIEPIYTGSSARQEYAEFAFRLV